MQANNSPWEPACATCCRVQKTLFHGSSPSTSSVSHSLSSPSSEMFGGKCDVDVSHRAEPMEAVSSCPDLLLIAEPVSEGVRPKDLLGKTGERWRKQGWDGGCLGQGSIQSSL